jgi:hypothetical protein
MLTLIYLYSLIAPVLFCSLLYRYFGVTTSTKYFEDDEPDEPPMKKVKTNDNGPAVPLGVSTEGVTICAVAPRSKVQRRKDLCVKTLGHKPQNSRRSSDSKILLSGWEAVRQASISLRR